MTKEKQAGPGQHPTWWALGNIDHDGRRYEAGDALPEMAPEALQALRDAGVVSQVAPVPDAPGE